MSNFIMARKLLMSSGREAVLDHLAPHLNESRSLRLSAFLLVAFALTMLALALWFKLLRRNVWEPEPIKEYNKEGKQTNDNLHKKLGMMLNGRSDMQLQKLLQSSSATAGLIFTVVGLVAAYAETGGLARLLLGFVGLGSQVVFLTWIYVESWGEFVNSVILTGTLVTAAFNTLSPKECFELDCLAEHSWEPVLITAMFYTILLSSLLNVFLAGGHLTGLLKVKHDVLLRRVFTTLDEHLVHMVDSSVVDLCARKDKSTSKTLVGELVDWCLNDEYIGEMKEKVYRGLKRTELRVVLAAFPTLVLTCSAIWLKSSWRWSGAAAIALMAASCSAMLFGFMCARQREHRLPLCFSRGIDILESFENATADLFGMERPELYKITWGNKDFCTNGEGLISTLYDYRTKERKPLRFDWETCDYMVIQTLGLAELGHFELQTAAWKDDKGNKYTDPNSNKELRAIASLGNTVEGLGKRRNLILSALLRRNPVKIGPTAVSKVAGVLMALTNATYYLKEHGDHIQM